MTRLKNRPHRSAQVASKRLWQGVGVAEVPFSLVGLFRCIAGHLLKNCAVVGMKKPLGRGLVHCLSSLAFFLSAKRTS